MDVAIADTDDADLRSPSSALTADVAALFRYGITTGIAALEIGSDPVAEHVYDLRPWFGER